MRPSYRLQLPNYMARREVDLRRKRRRRCTTAGTTTIDDDNETNSKRVPTTLKKEAAQFIFILSLSLSPLWTVAVLHQDVRFE